jgi:hypothetical protein
MRSAPTLKIWMTPFSSVAMQEKWALEYRVLQGARLEQRSAAPVIRVAFRVGPVACGDFYGRQAGAHRFSAPPAPA